MGRGSSRTELRTNTSKHLRHYYLTNTHYLLSGLLVNLESASKNCHEIVESTGWKPAVFVYASGGEAYVLAGGRRIASTQCVALGGISSKLTNRPHTQRLYSVDY
jgi:hypothetical protein